MADLDDFSLAHQESTAANAQEGPVGNTGNGLIGGLEGDGNGSGLEAGHEGRIDGGVE